jgi:uncharacterized membrane protein YfcA
MDNIILLVLTGFAIGTLGTLIGAGGGFILVPLLLLTHPSLSAEKVTSISMAIVACNAVSGTVAYARSRRIDYRAGIVFAVFTLPGSILGVLATRYIPRHLFNITFGAVLILLGIFLFFNTKDNKDVADMQKEENGWKHHKQTDRLGHHYSYYFNQYRGILISVIVGFLSPILGIGGGIIHVPALVQWLQFPVHIATATSQFILAVMSVVSVAVHIIKGSYHDPYILRMVIGLSLGVIAGAQLGAVLSQKMKGKVIIRALAVSLALVGVRILIGTGI